MRSHTWILGICGATIFVMAQQPDNATPAATNTRLNIPDKYTNLKILPATIHKPELVAIMKNFSRIFNVRCSYCHEATDDLSRADFASDIKPQKIAARQLLADILKTASTPVTETKP
ncbi:MAG TPA: hypothetical protein VJ453_00940 [Terriglobales bacterium]|nr:hypothetical protein [Terriglobales bacterium]